MHVPAAIELSIAAGMFVSRDRESRAVSHTNIKLPGKLAMMASVFLFSIGVRGLRADEGCSDHVISAPEISTISQIVRSCLSSEKKNERTVKFGNFVCLEKHLHVMTAEKYNLISSNSDYIFVHNNNGGVSISGAAIGDDIFDHKKTLIIYGYCLSACANYLFTAANRVIFIGSYSAGSFLGWHGSPVSDGLRAGVDPEKHQRAIEAHRDFLQRFTLARRDELTRLMDFSRDGAPAKKERDRGKMWTYTDDELCHEFGFKNIFRLSNQIID